jgi:hypothetical protein
MNSHPRQVYLQQLRFSAEFSCSSQAAGNLLQVYLLQFCSLAAADLLLQEEII